MVPGRFSSSLPGKKRASMFLCALFLFSGAAVLLSMEAEATVTPGSISLLVASGQLVHENSTAVPAFGVSATSSTGSDRLTRVEVTVYSRASGFSISDLDTISSDMSKSGIAIFRDNGATNDVLDSSDTAVSISSFYTSGSSPWRVVLNLSSESVPTSVSGTIQWFIVARTSPTIGASDAFQLEIGSGRILFSDSTTMPSSARTANTLTCSLLNAHYLGTSSPVPIGEDGIRVDTVAVQAFTLFSGRANLETISKLTVNVYDTGSFDLWTDLRPVDLTSGSGLMAYMDDGAGSSDSWSPLDDSRLVPTSVKVTNISSPVRYWIVELNFPSSGSGAKYVPTSSSGSHDMFVVVSASASISHSDKFYTRVPAWGLQLTGSAGEKKGAVQAANRSRDIKADTRGPDLTGASLRATADKGYFYEYDTDLSGRDEVFYNSVSGEGMGMVMRVAFQDFIEENFYELRGEAAFGQSAPSSQDPVTPTVAYTVTATLPNNPLTFTLEDKLGHTTTWDIYFTVDNNDPRVTELYASDASEYISTYVPTRSIWFRTNMFQPVPFHISGRASEPSGESGLLELTYTNEPSLYLSPSTDPTPADFNGSYYVTSTSTDLSSPLYLRFYDKVQNMREVQFNYTRVTALPVVQVTAPNTLGQNVSGVFRVLARVDSDAPISKMEFSTDGATGPARMAYGGSSGDWDTYYYDWDTYGETEGIRSIKVKATDSTSGVGYNTSLWVNVNNYPLWGYFVSIADGDAIRGKADATVKVSNFCKSVQLYLGDKLVDSFTGAPPGGIVSMEADTTVFKDGRYTLKAYLQGFLGRSMDLTISVDVDNTFPQVGKLYMDYPGSQTAARFDDKVSIKAVLWDNGTGIEYPYVVANSIGGSMQELLFDDGLHDDGVEGDGLYSTNEITVNATWAYHTLRLEATDKAGNHIFRRFKVPVDLRDPSVENAWIRYPAGQGAAKPGDTFQVVSQLSDLTSPIYITLVLDNSGSMWFSGSMGELIKAAKSFVNSTRSIDYLAVYRFAEDGEDGLSGPPGLPKRILNFTLMNQTGKSNARSIIDGIVELSGTPIWDAIGSAVQYTIANARSTPVVVAFTDGADDYTREDEPTFEEGSTVFCPWIDWGTSQYFSTHWGKYPDDTSSDYFWVQNPIDDWRDGLLNAPIPVYTIGLALEHHDPPNEPQRTTTPTNYEVDDNAYWTGESGTPEYNLWRIASTSAGGSYYYAPTAGQLESIYKEVARALYTGSEPARLSWALASVPLDITYDVILYDDGLHGEGMSEDGYYASDPITIPDMLWKQGDATVTVYDWANNTGRGTAALTIDPDAPATGNITVVYGTNQTAALDGVPFHIEVRANDPGSSIRKMVGDGTPIGHYPPILFNDTGRGNDRTASDGIYTSADIYPVTGNVPASYYFLEVSVLDQAGNMVKVKVQVRVVNDALAPVVEMLHPLATNGFLSKSDQISAYIRDDGVVEEVSFVLMDQGGSMVKQGYLVSSGGMLYSVPLDVSLYPESMYVLEVRARDTAGRTGSSGMLAVGVDNANPNLWVVTPRNGSYVSGRLQFQLQASDTFMDIVAYSVDQAQYIDITGGLDTTRYSEGYHDVEVRAVDRSGRYRSVRLGLYFDNSIPDMTLVSPSNAVMANGTVMLLARASDGGGLDFVEVQLYAWGNRSAPTLPGPGELPMASLPLEGPVQEVLLAGTFRGSIDTLELRDGKYLLLAVARDRAGEVGMDAIYFPVDNNAPELKVIYPVDTGGVSGMLSPIAFAEDPFLVDSYFIFNEEKHPLNASVDLSTYPDGPYKLRFEAFDISLRTSVVDMLIYIDRTAPTVDLLSPASEMSIEGTLRVLARVREDAGVRHAMLLMDGYTIAFGERIGNSELFSFERDISTFNRSAHRVQVLIENMAGHKGASKSITIYHGVWDTDGDGVLDPYDDAPTDPRVSGDYDGDGFGSRFDADDDGDGVPDGFEPKNQSLDVNGDPKGLTFSQDPTEWMDTDGDGIGDNTDPDIDNDGVLNPYDGFPRNATEWGDVDGDGIGDNIDPDIDGDGVANGKDRFPSDPTEWRDTDRDGIGNNKDQDDDGDGVPDGKDAFPTNRFRTYFWEPIFFIALIAVACTALIFSALVFRERIDVAASRSWEDGALRDIREYLARQLGAKIDQGHKGGKRKLGARERRAPAPKSEKPGDYKVRWERP